MKNRDKYSQSAERRRINEQLQAEKKENAMKMKLEEVRRLEMLEMAQQDYEDKIKQRMNDMKEKKRMKNEMIKKSIIDKEVLFCP